MLSPFGKFCRKLRIDNGELLKDMAEKLKVTPAYLSAVEVGKRNVPKEWPQIISEFYLLDGRNKQELQEAVKKSQLKVKIELNNYDDADKETILAFARQFTQLTDMDKQKIKSILRDSNK